MTEVYGEGILWPNLIKWIISMHFSLTTNDALTTTGAHMEYFFIKLIFKLQNV